MVLCRLQKILSRAGLASRREAEKLIQEGRVLVNDKVVRDLGFKADLEKDKIFLGDQLVEVSSVYHYYLYYKPRGLVVSKKDELGREGIFDRLKLPPEMNAVGRLDKDSEGLLLLSNDGDFVYRYTHPKFEVPKVYQVKISRDLQIKERDQLLKGLILDGRPAPLRRVKKIKAPKFESKVSTIAGASSRVLQKQKIDHWIELELIEGRNREIRRLMELLGIEVMRLIRVKHGDFSLKAMKPGDLKEVTIKTGPRERGGQHWFLT
ncbi:MAG: rRNA pseudouridine synthase [Deltaproteobacteria bacterium]|nr:rRNA pseudouridine synthase [Deltaproteobacteria bacterium]